MRFPAGVYTGLPSTSILELDAAAAALSALGTARGLEAVSGLVDGDLLRAGAGFTEASLDVDGGNIPDVTISGLSLCVSAEAGWEFGAGVHTLEGLLWCHILRSVMMSMSCMSAALALYLDKSAYNSPSPSRHPHPSHPPHLPLRPPPTRLSTRSLILLSLQVGLLWAHLRSWLACLRSPLS